jgi:general L-amino acid transport system substrate-binding protein
MKCFVGLLFAIVVLVASLPASAQLEEGPVLQRIRERGELICGVNPGLRGFSYQDNNGQWLGFDVDICRAVAAAILGDADAVQYVPVQSGERPIFLQTGTVDMLSRNTTLTLSRDTAWEVRFGPVTFYDGQGIMVRRESGIISLEVMAGGTICVQSGTTTLPNIREALENRDLPYRVINAAGSEIQAAATQDFPPTTLQTFDNADDMMSNFFAGRCDAVTTDLSGLAARRAAAPVPDELIILNETLSKEPLAPLSPDSDPGFANIIMWTVYGLIQAEEYGITQTNVDTFTMIDNPSIQRFLGQSDESTGDYLTLENDFMMTVIREVGNYGEIYERHLGPETDLGLERNLNRLYTEGGLLYSPPFR